MPKGIPNERPIASNTVVVDTNNQYQTIFLQVVRDMLPNLRLYSDAMLVKKIGQEKVTELSLEFFGVITAGTATQLTKNEQLALASQVIKCLVKYIQGMQLPVTLKTLLDSIPLLTEAVNTCYPGYISSRLLRYTILPARAQ